MGNIGMDPSDCPGRGAVTRRKGGHMYTIEFYENAKGDCDLRDLLRVLYDTQKNDFYKVAAFLDFLEEKGAVGDKMICSCPEGTIHMHCIPGFERIPEGWSADPVHSRAGPGARRRKDVRSDDDSLQEPAVVCVLLYGLYREYEGGKDTFVMLHHYFTDGIPSGVHLLQMYQAVRELQKHRLMR